MLITTDYPHCMNAPLIATLHFLISNEATDQIDFVAIKWCVRIYGGSFLYTMATLKLSLNLEIY